MECRRTFSEHTGKALAGSWYPHRWPELCRELVQQTSVRETARRLGVAPSTAFRWRHRVLQALADHRERAGRRQLGRPGAGLVPETDRSVPEREDVEGEPSVSGTDTPAHSAPEDEVEDEVGGSVERPVERPVARAAGGKVGVMPLRFRVAAGRGPDPKPSRFFRVLVAADSAGRVALDHDVPGEITGPPGSPLPLWDWVSSDRAAFQFPLEPADRVPSPRRFLARWVAPGCEIRWIGWRFYQWSKVTAEFGMTAVRWPPPGEDLDEGGEEEVATRAWKLARDLRRWLSRYHGLSTRWLRGYLALFAELEEARLEAARREARLERARLERAQLDRSQAKPAPWKQALWDPAAWRRFRERHIAGRAWRVAGISLLGPEGPEATLRRNWVR